jgi:DNA-binding NarL/FixJ family response regulator
MRSEFIMTRAGEEDDPPHMVGRSPFSNSPSIPVKTHTEEPGEAGNPRPQPRVVANPERSAVISIAVIDEHSFTRECITKSLPELCNLLDITGFAACDECLRSPRSHDLVLFHAHESVAKRDNDQLLGNLKKLLEIGPVIVLCDVDCIESITAAFDNGARGYIPTATTSLDLAVEIIHLVRAGGTFVPLSSLPGRTSARQGGSTAVSVQPFTARQKAVLDRIKLGKTNKIIAHELEMSESTVKVHIRNIMKKLNATNRTEVASRAHEMEMRGTRSTG